MKRMRKDTGTGKVGWSDHADEGITTHKDFSPTEFLSNKTTHWSHVIIVQLTWQTKPGPRKLE